MLKRICDRCGAEVLRPSTGFELHNDLDEVIDLCEKCDKELNKWMDDPETKVVDPLEEDAKFASIPNTCKNDTSGIKYMGKITVDSSLPKYFTVSREEYEALQKDRQTVRKIIDIVYRDDIDNYEKTDRIIDIL